MLFDIFKCIPLETKIIDKNHVVCNKPILHSSDDACKSTFTHSC